MAAGRVLGEDPGDQLPEPGPLAIEDERLKGQTTGPTASRLAGDIHGDFSEPPDRQLTFSALSLLADHYGGIRSVESRCHPEQVACGRWF